MAANLRDIRRRIKSVKNTAQITKAMQMVAASKMRKAQNAALTSRPYAELMNRMLASLREHMASNDNEFLKDRPVHKELVLVITTDKGLCGGLNTNLLREVSQFDTSKTLFVAAGRKAAQYLSRTKRNMIADFELKDTPTLLDIKAISKFCIEKFRAKEVDKVTVAFTRFVNTLTQTPTLQTLLPINPENLPTASEEPLTANAGAPYIFEPDEDEVLNALLPHYIHYQTHQMTLDARASEHSARMVAMKNATDNAEQLIKDLTLDYNKLRQAGITTELLEISTAQMSLG